MLPWGADALEPVRRSALAARPSRVCRRRAQLRRIGNRQRGHGAQVATSDTTEASTELSSTGSVSFDQGGGDDKGGECSIWEQDCPPDENGIPWSDQPDLVPDEIRCCPEVGNPRLPGEACTVQDYFGSCLDDCAEGSLCMDIDGDGEGVCQPLCSGSPDNPECAPDEACLIYFAGVPLCFPKCDPLIQDCQAGWGCYPDADVAGGTGFICMPTIGASMQGQDCWLLSNCEPGLICVTPDYLPECVTLVGCCTELCDITEEPDPCPLLHPDLACISWYHGGQVPPSVELQNVGACALPP